jgi:hypothetical protein
LVPSICFLSLGDNSIIGEISITVFAGIFLVVKTPLPRLWEGAITRLGRSILISCGLSYIN